MEDSSQILLKESNNEYQMAGEQRIEIDMSNLPIGQYICQISEKKSKIATQRFAKIE